MKEWLYKISPCHRIVGNEPAPKGWLEAMRFIYDHELVIFSDSDFLTGIITDTGLEEYACPADSFIIVPPGVKHVSREVAGRNGHRHWVHFDWEYAGETSSTPVITYCPARPQEEFFRPAPDYIPDGIIQGSIKNPMKVTALLNRIDSLWNHGSAREQSISRGLLLELLLELLTEESEAQPLSQDTSARVASRARSQLNNFAKIPLRDASSVESYLERNGTTYAHQCRVFKQHYGISPLQYVNEIRMSEIKNLLSDTDLPISAIAEIAGYDNLGYFSRSFRKHTGMSPRMYRASML